MRNGCVSGTTITSPYATSTVVPLLQHHRSLYFFKRWRESVLKMLLPDCTRLDFLPRSTQLCALKPTRLSSAGSRDTSTEIAYLRRSNPPHTIPTSTSCLFSIPVSTCFEIAQSEIAPSSLKVEGASLVSSPLLFWRRTVSCLSHRLTSLIPNVCS